jgi:hypothetical protein
LQIEYKIHRKTHPYTAPQPKKCKMEGCDFAGRKLEFNQHMRDVHGIKITGKEFDRTCFSLGAFSSCLLNRKN